MRNEKGTNLQTNKTRKLDSIIRLRHTYSMHVVIVDATMRHTVNGIAIEIEIDARLFTYA